MAELIDSRKKSNKRSTRVDLTPMVDLGFLLITFFIFTTTMSKPTGLKIFLPKAVPDSLQNQTPASGALTVLLAANNIFYYYEGADLKKIRSANSNELRTVILDKKKRTAPAKLMVIIKPGKDADFESIVNVMDEMTIDDVKRYAMVDIDPGEYSMMHQ
jgi:biopolymer transport protein ExbD